MSSTVSSLSSSSPTAPKLWTLLLMMSSSNSSNGGSSSSSRHTSRNQAKKTKKTKTPPPPPPPPKRHILSQLDPQSTTLRDLYDAAQQAFHDDIIINLRKNEELELQRDGIRMGQINRDDDETCTRLTLTNSPDINLVQAGLQSQDRILVVWKESKTNSNKKKIDKKKSAATAATAAFQKKTKTAAPKKKKKQHDDDEEESSEDDDDEGMTAAVASSTFTTRRPQRQAAAQATASFAETIRQQDELMMMQQQQQQKQQSKSSKRARTAASRSSSRNNNHTRSLPPVKRSRHAAFSSTAGRRLHDGAEFVAGGAASTTTTRRRPQKQAPKTTTFGDSSNTSEDPAVMALLEATSSAAAAAAANTNTRQGRLMRAGWKQAVQNAVEQNKAVARLAAIASGKFRILVTTTATAASATATDNNKFTISFAKGVQGRGEYQDENVDALSVELLQSVLASIHPINPEALRPENLALLSPRVLWSVVYHHQQQQQQHDDDDNTRQQGMDIVQALQTIQPNLDWSFLRRRKQQLSAKARENLRQKQQQQQQEDDWQAAADAIESVELAMGDLTSAFEQQQQQRQGILSATQPTMTTFTIVTPAETDLDELQDCMRDSASNMPEGARGTSLPEDLSSEYLQLAQDLVDTCNVHNWRELANCSDKIENLVETLKPKHSWLNDSIVQGWIDQAQLHSLDEIMVEICEGNTSAVEILRDAANSGTPKDLSVWRGIAGALREQLESSSVTGNNESDLPPEEQLAEWCERAYQAIESVEWLDWYATPIGD